MFFKKEKCSRCSGKLKEEFSFCPYCGDDRRNPQKDMRDYGMLGKNEAVDGAPLIGGGSMGFADNLFQSLFNGLMKSLEGQMKTSNGDMQPDIRVTTNGIVVNLTQGVQQKRRSKTRVISEEQIKRMAQLPRAEAKTDVRRLSDKVVYEVKTPGVNSIEDIFVSKVESGYEVKIIGEKKVYVNTFSLDLPLKGYGLMKDSVLFEFGL